MTTNTTIADVAEWLRKEANICEHVAVQTAMDHPPAVQALMRSRAEMLRRFAAALAAAPSPEAKAQAVPEGFKQIGWMYSTDRCEGDPDGGWALGYNVPEEFKKTACAEPIYIAAALASAPAQPVAMTDEQIDAFIPQHPEPHTHYWMDTEKAAIRKAIRAALAAHRQQEARGPLTPDELRNLADRCTPNTETGALNYLKFARAIEAAHGIKGE